MPVICFSQRDPASWKKPVKEPFDFDEVAKNQKEEHSR